MRLTCVAAVIALAASSGGCTWIQTQPAVGTIDSCTAEATLCRPIAEAAAHAIPGPAFVLDSFTIEDAACDITINDELPPPETASATACYVVDASGVVGGERVRPRVYKGGKPISIESVVWVNADGSLKARTRVTDNFAS
jgi:hypothetical protein